MEIKPYKSFGPLRFGHTTRIECLQTLGQPLHRQINREGTEELQYEKFIIRFDPTTLTIRECTLLPFAHAKIEGINVTWDREFLRLACKYDGLPKNIHGFIVFLVLGIAVTGIHDNDDAQLAITAFSEGEFDNLLSESIPFIFTSG